MIHHWQALTAPRLQALAARDPVAILTLGAIEQHGSHLPLGTDLIIGEGLQQAMLEMIDPDLEVLCLPSLAVGASDEHSHFAGTLSLPPALAIATLEAYGESVARAGIRKLVLLNAHGGNKAVMDLAALTLRKRFELRVVKATYTRLPPLAGAIEADELRFGLHGGLLETAMMLHLAPSQVHMEGYVRAAPARPETPEHLLGPEGAAAYAWMGEDLSLHGVAGDATGADADLGRRLVEHYGAGLARVIAETAALPPLHGR
ncbi:MULTISPECIES: creatininase family protein [unclassified Halomonas]|uniref:creatininase family protein n=1 Tax=unclassified Halomonas TaxID=2609666 RepID=UPI0020A226F7|nr:MULTISPECIES: creatininase family protein [unclassified Halomonas]MCP1314248.1 creatininase family protein [Halomonas sp. 707D7]MCP1325709.1 creatininase family protein [Halomonas sp. 707D4]